MVMIIIKALFNRIKGQVKLSYFAHFIYWYTVRQEGYTDSTITKGLFT